MNIFRFINSKDIREYLRELQHQFRDLLLPQIVCLLFRLHGFDLRLLGMLESLSEKSCLKTAHKQKNSAEPEKKEPEKKTVFYVTDEKEQGQYIRMFKDAGLNAVILDQVIDTPFIGFMEQKHEELKFTRIDADLSEAFKEENAEAADQKQQEALIALFRKAAGNDQLEVKVENLKDSTVASMMTMSEEGRRMQEMMKMYAAYGMDMGALGEKDQTLVLNAGNDLVKRLLKEDGEEALRMQIAEQLYDMALLSRGGLSQERMTAFIRRSQELMMKLS